MCIDAVCTSNALLLNFTMQFNRFYIRATNSTKRSQIQPMNSLQRTKEQRIEHLNWNESLDNTYVPPNILKLHRICNDSYDNVISIYIWKKKKFNASVQLSFHSASAYMNSMTNGITQMYESTF